MKLEDCKGCQVIPCSVLQGNKVVRVKSMLLVGREAFKKLTETSVKNRASVLDEFVLAAHQPTGCMLGDFGITPEDQKNAIML